MIHQNQSTDGDSLLVHRHTSCKRSLLNLFSTFFHFLPMCWSSLVNWGKHTGMIMAFCLIIDSLVFFPSLGFCTNSPRFPGDTSLRHMLPVSSVCLLSFWSKLYLLFTRVLLPFSVSGVNLPRVLPRCHLFSCVFHCFMLKVLFILVSCLLFRCLAVCPTLACPVISTLLVLNPSWFFLPPVSVFAFLPVILCGSVC